jgi:hypothetical protein
VVVDIPGINEAGSCDKYMKYVKEKWATFDCVVVVMDGKQGVNSGRTSQSSECRQGNLDTKVLSLSCATRLMTRTTKNEAGLIAEARLKVEEIFDVGCRETALRSPRGD